MRRETVTLTLSDKDWRAFNRKVRQELREGKGIVYPDEQTFLRDLKRRIGVHSLRQQS